MKKFILLIFLSLSSLSFAMDQAKIREFERTVSKIWGGQLKRSMNTRALEKTFQLAQDLASKGQEQYQDTLYVCAYHFYNYTIPLEPIMARPHSRFRSYLLLMKLQETSELTNNAKRQALNKYAKKLNHLDQQTLKANAQEKFEIQYKDILLFNRIAKKLELGERYSVYSPGFPYIRDKIIPFINWAKRNSIDFSSPLQAFLKFFTIREIQTINKLYSALLLSHMIKNNTLQINIPNGYDLKILNDMEDLERRSKFTLQKSKLYEAHKKEFSKPEYSVFKFILQLRHTYPNELKNMAKKLLPKKLKRKTKESLQETQQQKTKKVTFKMPARTNKLKNTMELQERKK